MILRSGHLTSLGILALSIVLPACSGVPTAISHHAKYVFSGKVTDESGKPVTGALVKVMGWESLTNESGEWQQEHLVHCGAIREHMNGFEEQDSILVVADGFHPEESSFSVEHAAWFSGCEKPEQSVKFEVRLVSLNKTLPKKVAKKTADEKMEKKEDKNDKNDKNDKKSLPSETPVGTGVSI